MSPFRRERPPARNKLISLRVSPEEDRLLDELMSRLGLGAKVDVFRAALDYFVNNAPEAQPKKGKG
jgi:hypothetical protein